MNLSIDTVDVVIIGAYLVGIVGLGCWVGIRRETGGASRGYFLAGGTLGWPVIGLALYCRYGIMPSSMGAGAGIITRETAAKVMELSKKNYR